MPFCPVHAPATGALVWDLVVLTLWNIVLWVVAITLLAPAAVFCVQCLASLFPRRSPGTALIRPPVAVLTPAHNEQAMLGATLDALRSELTEGDIALVVADNCTDDTANIARRRGVEVVERHDPLNIGKGHALAFGVEQVCVHA